MYWVHYHQERNNEKCPEDGGHKVDNVCCSFCLLRRLFFGWLSDCERGCLGVLGWVYGLDKLLDLNQR